jgi:hypothetical protein
MAEGTEMDAVERRQLEGALQTRTNPVSNLDRAFRSTSVNPRIVIGEAFMPAPAFAYFMRTEAYHVMLNQREAAADDGGCQPVKFGGQVTEIHRVRERARESLLAWL